MSIKEHPPQQHVPVLLDDVLQLLNPHLGETYLDLTAGYGGHARKVLKRTDNLSGATLVDRDEYAVSQLKPLSDEGATVLRNDFASAAERLVADKRQFDMILVDLGVSSPQLDRSERGFSFSHNGPLDMRMDNSQSLSAAEVVNEWPEAELTRIIHEFGEEPFTKARTIAQAIIAARPVNTTGQLAEIIAANYRGRKTKIHPATRTFQAIRIAVNDELGQIERVLPLLPKLLKSGGRVAVISFHSLEDRLVKRFFKEQAGAGFEAELSVITKKPIDGRLSDVHNPRARSAKLRAAVKI